MQIYRKSVMLTHMAIDVTIIASAFFFHQFYYRANISSSIVREAIIFIGLALSWLWAGKFTGLYDEFRSRNFSFELIALVKVVMVQMVAGFSMFYMGREIDLPRSFLFEYAAMVFVACSISKYLFRYTLQKMRLRGRNLRNILIIGAGEMGLKFSQSITQNPHFGYNLIGFIDDERKPYLNGSYLGPIGSLDNVLNANHVDVVIVALPNVATERIADVVEICERHTTRVKIIPNYFRFMSSRYSVTMFGEFPILSLREDHINEFHWRILKRAFDYFVSLFAFVAIFSWLWPIIAIAIKLTSKGPVFFKQERWGRNNRRFYAYKFRSMAMDCESMTPEGRFVQASKDDPRVTRVGRLLRRTNLDELPQFLNVLKGEMSVVGPRPHPTPLNNESRAHVPQYMLRHLVKPGITGWAQVSGYRGETKDIALMQKRIEHDIWYIENWSLWLDIQIMFLTVWNMVKGDPNAY